MFVLNVLAALQRRRGYPWFVLKGFVLKGFVLKGFVLKVVLKVVLGCCLSRRDIWE